MLNFILGEAIASYVREHRALVAIAIVLTAISAIFVVIPAYLLQPFVDEGMRMGSEPVSWKIPWIELEPGSWFSWNRTERVLVENVSPNRLLMLLTAIAFLAILLRSLSMYLGNLSAVAFANRAVRSLRIDLFRKFVSLPLGFYAKRRSGELVARATADLTALQNRISNVIIGLVEHPLTAAVFLIYLLFMNYKLTLFILLVAPIVLGLMRLFGKKAGKHATKVQDATADVTSAYQEMLLCLKVVHGFFRGDFEVKRFRVLADHLYKRVMRWHRWNLGVSPMMDTTLFLVLPGLLVAGKVFFNHTLGELISMIYAFSRLYSPIRKLAKVNNNLRTLQGATKRVFAIMATTPAIADSPRAKPLPRHHDSIEFRKTRFEYSPGEPVLQDISFTVRAGEMAAFVGSTGAGKSTLLNLIPRFYDVSGGSILIDGMDVRDVTIESLRGQIGIVNQETILFNDTIANNIAYGSSRKDMEGIVEAAKAAQAHDFIVGLAEAYESVIGDQGGLLSGGQRQRIAIARALYIDPAILMLDEAASALDAESERRVQQAIENLKGGRTILVVAHRLSTITRADIIHVVESGRIIESGNLQTLLAVKGRFRQLYDMQYKDGTYG